MLHHGLVVANHASWLDIFALNAAQRVYFVSKSEVARWPAIGWLARATGTVFINRKSTEARRQQAEFDSRLRAGHRLLFFPEGTSTDSTFILPFKSTLFAALFAPGMGDLWVQPATLRYTAPLGAPADFYGWWGDMGFAPHLMTTLMAAYQGHIAVVLHPALRVADFKDRKELAGRCEQVVRAGFASMKQ
jgi:1-acyl-sn-glycerol-3-phosphate acyltransferase